MYLLLHEVDLSLPDSVVHIVIVIQCLLQSLINSTVDILAIHVSQRTRYNHSYQDQQQDCEVLKSIWKLKINPWTQELSIAWIQYTHEKNHTQFEFPIGASKIHMFSKYPQYWQNSRTFQDPSSHFFKTHIVILFAICNHKEFGHQSIKFLCITGMA